MSAPSPPPPAPGGDALPVPVACSSCANAGVPDAASEATLAPASDATGAAPSKRLRVLLIHGAINSGKTTTARRWVEQQRELGLRVGGVLAEKTPHGRVFIDLLRPGDPACALEHPAPEEAVVSVGRFQFRAAAFVFARGSIERAVEGGAGADSGEDAAAAPAEQRPADAVVLDEYGPLEARGEGFAATVQRLLRVPPSHSQSPSLLVVLLVRSALLEHLVATIRAADPNASIAFEPPLTTQQPQAARVDAPQ